MIFLLLSNYAGGQRKRETFAKLEDAKRWAGEVARAMLNGRLAAMELTSADREAYVSALELLKPLGIPLHSAIEEYVAARSHLDGESLLSAVKEHAAGEIVNEMLMAKKHDGLSPRYLYMLGSDLTRFRNAFKTNISSITSAVTEDWLAAQRVTARTRNNLRASINPEAYEKLAVEIFGKANVKTDLREDLFFYSVSVSYYGS
jgi:hypothetical protein